MHPNPQKCKSDVGFIFRQATFNFKHMEVSGDRKLQRWAWYFDTIIYFVGQPWMVANPKWNSVNFLTDFGIEFLYKRHIINSNEMFGALRYTQRMWSKNHDS